ncbi:MAG: RecB family exonuclease [Jatrophihabitans sp.]
MTAPPTGQDALPLTGVRRLFSCTPSRLAAFDCPRRYRFTYLQRPMPPKGPPWAHNTLGAIVHLALHRWWSLPTENRTSAAGGELVERNWTSDGFRDGEQSAQWRAVARAWVAGYLVGVDPEHEPIGVERTVAARTERLAVSGRADRIDDRGAELVVVDYKTGRHVPDEGDTRGSLALALYALATSRVFRRPSRTVELHHLPTRTVSAFTHTDETIARQVGRAEATADDIVAATDTLASGADPDEVFPPAPGPGCSWCDFRKHCPEGQRAAPERHPWAALADLDH